MVITGKYLPPGMRGGGDGGGGDGGGGDGGGGDGGGDGGGNGMGDGGDGNPAAAAIVSEHLLVMATAPYPLAWPPQSSTVALLVGMVTSTSVMLLIL